MFSYRHAFHAGNHADVLKHTVLIATLRHLLQKDTALTVFDTHAGAGLYRLDDNYAQTSGEALGGITKLIAATSDPKFKQASLAPALKDYLEFVAGFNTPGSGAPTSNQVYPGSPFIIQKLLRERDKLKLFELHPTDSRVLAANIAELKAGRQVAVLNENGFEGLKQFLPPPARRALVLCDPSYEIKDDYRLTSALIADSLKRFATGSYAVWYPILSRREAQDLPRKLQQLANKSAKSWLHTTLTVKSSKPTKDDEGNLKPAGLCASGMFLFNPPYTLRAALQLAVPQMATLLGQDQYAGSTVEFGG
jgi:23S rRNA (adenine2030-N6)-methyltransferase